MLYVYFVLLDLILLFFAFNAFSDKKRIIVTLAESMAFFLSLFTLVSAPLWLLKEFTVGIGLLAVSFLCCAFFAFAFIYCRKNGKNFLIVSSRKISYDEILNAVAIFIAVFMSLGVFSTFGIGYNDGNAKVQALSIITGSRSTEFEVKEFRNILPESGYEAFFVNAVENIDREDFTAEFGIAEADSEQSDSENEDLQIGGVLKPHMMGDFGNNPVYPSILALSASVFGFKNISYIQAFFAFCVFVFVSEILRELRCDWKLRSVLILLLGASPIIVYSNRTTVIEPIIGFCLITFLYFLLCKNNKMQVLSSIAVVMFSFLHSSIYTMLPLFLVIYWMLFVHTRKKRLIISGFITVLGYLLGFLYLDSIAHTNTSINYRIGLSVLGDNYRFFVFGTVILLTVISAVFLIVIPKTDIQKIKTFERNIGAKVFKILISAVSVVMTVSVVILGIKTCDSYNDIFKLTLVSFMICSGLVLLPYILVRLFIGAYRVGTKEAVVTVAFVYSILLYSSVMKHTIDGYYYDARYLSSFIPIIILCSGIMLRLLKAEEKYFIPIIGIIFMITPYTSSLLTDRAETRFDTSLYEDVMKIAEEEEEDTIVLLEKDLMKYYYYPLIQTTDLKVYPIEANALKDLCMDTNERKSKVLYITDRNGDAYHDKGTILYFRDNTARIIEEENYSELTGLPIRFSDVDKGVIQVLEFDSLEDMLNPENFDVFDIDKMNLRIKDVEIDEDETAYITVSVSDGKDMLYDEKYNLSFHLEYENSEDIFENYRIPLGSYVYGDYVIELDLSENEENTRLITDIVEENVMWYSDNNEVPTVDFIHSNEGWTYMINEGESE